MSPSSFRNNVTQGIIRQNHNVMITPNQNQNPEVFIGARFAIYFVADGLRHSTMGLTGLLVEKVMEGAEAAFRISSCTTALVPKGTEPS